MVAAHMETARAGEKQQRRMAAELGAFRGRELYAATPPGADGMRRHMERLREGSLEDLRAVAQSFAGQPRAVYLAVVENPPSVLLASSADSGLDAGQAVKAAVAGAGGRGGGTARMAQGSVPELSALDAVIRLLT
jgi:alanyl-tRNA synthetase